MDEINTQNGGMEDIIMNIFGIIFGLYLRKNF